VTGRSADRHSAALSFFPEDQAHPILLRNHQRVTPPNAAIEKRQQVEPRNGIQPIIFQQPRSLFVLGKKLFHGSEN
jgi:hypothetical protein